MEEQQPSTEIQKWPAAELRQGRLPLCSLFERCINRLKQWGGIATRYDKSAAVYLAALHVAGILVWSAR